MPGPNPRELVCAEYHGFVVKETKKSFGLGVQPTGKAEFYVPKSISGRITYTGPGNQLDILVGQRIEAFEVQRWFARQQQLIGSLE